MAEIGKVYRLRFEDYPDAEIRVRSVSLATLMGVAEQMPDLGDLGSLSPDVQRKVLTDTYQVFIDSVIDWNLEVAGPDGELQPVPVTLEAAMALPDPTFLRFAVEQWRDLQVKVPDPLPTPSGSGATSPEGSIPMAPR